MLKRLLMGWLCIFPLMVQCQLIDIVDVHAGISLFPGSESINNEGIPGNIYGGYNAGQNIGGGLYKFVTDKIQIGVVADYMRTSKPSYALSVFKVHGVFKYNFIQPDVYRLSPYVFGGAGLAFVSLNQTSFVSTFVPVPETYGIHQIAFDTIINQGPSYSYFTPALSGNIGLGVDVNVYYNYNLFLEGSYNAILAKNMTVNDAVQNPYLSNNQSNITYFNLTVGLRIYMY